MIISTYFPVLRKCLILIVLLSLSLAALPMPNVGDTIYVSTRTDINKLDKSSGKVFVNVDEDAGKGQRAAEFVSKKTKYPSQAKKEDVQGNVVRVRFVVDTDGEVKQARVLVGASPSLDEEALRVVNSLPRLTPALKDGRPVPVHMMMPVAFRMQKRPNDVSSTSGFWLAEYKGGEKAMLAYLTKNLKYPENAARDIGEGRVIVRFYITPQGEISDARVVQSGHFVFDKEAMRVVSAMSDWLPAVYKGEAVLSDYVIPVNFKIDHNKLNQRKKPQKKRSAVRW